jgi:hypothetical protein
MLTVDQIITHIEYQMKIFLYRRTKQKLLPSG